MSKFYTEKVKGLTPYVPGEQPKDKKYIKLNTNECPYPPSPEAVEAIRSVDAERIALYPDPESTMLKDTIADRYNVERKNVFVGNGSDEVLALAFQTFFEEGSSVKFPDISYSFYPVYANLYGIEADVVPLKADFTLPVEEMLNAEGGVIFPNPNAPTAMAVSIDEVKRILEGNRERVVIVDEAYIDFGGESAVELVAEYENLLVVQTFSKSRAMAGMRVGYAIGSEVLIEGLERVKNSFNSYPIDYVAQRAAIASMQDEVYNKKIQEKVCSTRERTKAELEKLRFAVTDSKANFLFVSHERMQAEEIFEALRRDGILVRYFKKPRIDNWLRISVGTAEDMESLVECLRRIV